jgi:hypothetical protein
MASDVFLSFAQKDEGIAKSICSSLEQAGIQCWIAPRNIMPGEEYADAIIDALNNCRVFLLIFSKASNDSSQVTREVERAASKDLMIFTLRIDDTLPSKAMEYYLSNHQWMDISKTSLSKEMSTLTDTVSKLLKRSPQSKKGMDVVKAKKPDTPNTVINPFIFGNPVSDPALFYGRKAEIRQILNRLLSSAHESTSVVGERRIGKTSLLNHLSNQEVAASLGLPKDKFCLVYVDFQGLTDITPQRFWQRVLTKIGRSICDESLVPVIKELSQQTIFDLFDLEDLFEQISNKGFTIVLFMDEFEYITQNPNFKSDFFGGLRSLAIHHGVALIPATRRELVDLCHSDEIKGSPFFNIFANVVLRPFNQSEVNELLDGYLKGTTLSFSSSEKEYIFPTAGGYPFFVQMAAHYLFDGKVQGLTGVALTTYASGNFGVQADAHYNYLWSHCSESEKITLIIILTLGLEKASKRTIPTMENLARLRPRAPQDIADLDKRGLIKEMNGEYSLFSPSLVQWIRREIVASPGEQESPANAEEWLKSGGHQAAAKQAKELFPKFKKKYWSYIQNLAVNLGYEVAANFFVILTGMGH